MNHIFLGKVYRDIVFWDHVEHYDDEEACFHESEFHNRCTKPSYMAVLTCNDSDAQTDVELSQIAPGSFCKCVFPYDARWTNGV